MASTYTKRGKTLAKAALAKSNTVELNVTGVYEVDRIRFHQLYASLGVSFDSNNQVIGNSTNSAISTLETDTAAMLTRIVDLETRLTNYETHTHNYVDSTINDTADGSGTQTDTVKTTEVIN